MELAKLVLTAVIMVCSITTLIIVIKREIRRKNQTKE